MSFANIADGLVDEALLHLWDAAQTAGLGYEGRVSLVATVAIVLAGPSGGDPSRLVADAVALLASSTDGGQR